jgi:alcohol dehydrogenase
MGFAGDFATVVPMVPSLVADERILKGSPLGFCVPRRHLPRQVAPFESGRMEVEKLPTHRLRLEDPDEGFDRLHDGTGASQVIRFDEAAVPCDQ